MENFQIKEDGNIHEQLETARFNSLLIDQACDKIPYVNEEVLDYKTSTRNLVYMENWFIDKYFNKIRDTAYLYTFASHEERTKYSSDPYRLAYDKYGSIDLAYVIMMLNNIDHPIDFFALSSVYLPDIKVLEEIVQTELNNRKD